MISEVILATGWTWEEQRMLVCRQFRSLDVGFYDFSSDIGNRMDMLGAKDVCLPTVPWS